MCIVMQSVLVLIIWKLWIPINKSTHKKESITAQGLHEQYFLLCLLTATTWPWQKSNTPHLTLMKKLFKKSKKDSLNTGKINKITSTNIAFMKATLIHTVIFYIKIWSISYTVKNASNHYFIKQSIISSYHLWGSAGNSCHQADHYDLRSPHSQIQRIPHGN